MCINGSGTASEIAIFKNNSFSMVIYFKCTQLTRKDRASEPVLSIFFRPRSLLFRELVKGKKTFAPLEKPGKQLGTREVDPYILTALFDT